MIIIIKNCPWWQVRIWELALSENVWTKSNLGNTLSDHLHLDGGIFARISSNLEYWSLELWSSFHDQRLEAQRTVQRVLQLQNHQPSDLPRMVFLRDLNLTHHFWPQERIWLRLLDDGQRRQSHLQKSWLSGCLSRQAGDLLHQLDRPPRICGHQERRSNNHFCRTHLNFDFLGYSHLFPFLLIENSHHNAIFFPAGQKNYFLYNTLILKLNSSVNFFIEKSTILLHFT